MELDAFWSEIEQMDYRTLKGIELTSIIVYTQEKIKAELQLIKDLQEELKKL